MSEYLPPATQEEVTALIGDAGKRATVASPIVWLRMELERPSVSPQIKLTQWPTGDEHVLGTAHFHGAWVKWGEG